MTVTRGLVTSPPAPSDRPGPGPWRSHSPHPEGPHMRVSARVPQQPPLGPVHDSLPRPCKDGPSPPRDAGQTGEEPRPRRERGAGSGGAVCVVWPPGPPPGPGGRKAARPAPPYLPALHVLHAHGVLGALALLLLVLLLAAAALLADAEAAGEQQQAGHHSNGNQRPGRHCRAGEPGSAGRGPGSRRRPQPCPALGTARPLPQGHAALGGAAPWTSGDGSRAP